MYKNFLSLFFSLKYIEVQNHLKTFWDIITIFYTINIENLPCTLIELYKMFCIYLVLFLDLVSVYHAKIDNKILTGILVLLFEMNLYSDAPLKTT